MLKKTVLTFAFLTILTTFYGFNAQFSTPVTDDMLLNDDAADFGNSLLGEGDYVISAYDNVIRNISEKEGHGLMQIMPSVARQFDVPTEQVSNPETNIWLANKLMSKIMNTLRFPEGTPEKDRMSIILASYNSGIGHVNDARRLARLNGEDQFVGGRGPLPATQGAARVLRERGGQVRTFHRQPADAGLRERRDRTL